MTFAQDLADDLCAITYEDLPTGTAEHAKMAIASTLAASALGQQAPTVAIVRDLVRRRRGAPEALIWFAGGDRVPVGDAARLNHMAADESMADDSALLNGSHLGSAVTAAAIAVAERVRASGPLVIAAIVAGYEAALRIARAEAQLRERRNAHVSGLNAFGCAVAAAKILDSSPAAMAHSIALAATGTSGVDRVSTDTARAYQAGMSAGIGVEAALAAHHGYRADSSVMERYLDTIRFDGTPNGNSASATGAADGTWAIDTELIIKLRPGAFLYGSAVEAALRTVRDNPVVADDIDHVTVRGHRFIEETDKNRPLPTGSLAHYVASALVRRDFPWTQFADGYGNDPAILSLRDRVRIESTSQAEAPGTWGWAAEVTTATRDGRSYQATVNLPPGSVMAGIGWTDIETKMRALMRTADITDDVIGQILEHVKQLEHAASLSPLTDLLR